MQHNHTEEWEKELSENWDKICSNETTLKVFISQALKKQKEEMAEKLITIEATCPICLSKKCNHIIQENKMVYVEDVLRLLEQSYLLLKKRGDEVRITGIKK